MPLDERTLQEHHFPCETCGSDLRFNPAGKDLVCDHCGNHQGIDHTKAEPLREQDFDVALRAEHRLKSMDQVSDRVAACPNCAAEVSFDPDIDAQDCPFCATPLVIGSVTSKHVKPSGVLPFTLEEADARNAMIDWLGGLWFAPSGLKKFARKGRKLTGVYVPYWTYDTSTKTEYFGQRGTTYYETRSITRNGKLETRRVAKTRWRSASGQVARDFDDILVLASKSLPLKHTDRLAPWDLSALTPFDPHYLAGFRAESYTIDIEAGFQEAKIYMDRMITRDIKFDIGGDKQRITSAQTDVSAVSFKHVLLPVWVAAYKYRGESYRFVVNGQTGAVSGARPYSKLKIAIAILTGLLLAASLGYTIAMTQ